MNEIKRPIILVLCTGNSCRSHMAEGYLKDKLGDIFDIQSAGAAPSGYVHPVAQEVMLEIGIDISEHHSKHLDEFMKEGVHTVITVCNNAETCCPTFPGEKNHYCWTFADPADAKGTEEEIKDEFRRVRDEIVSVFDENSDLLVQSA